MDGKKEGGICEWKRRATYAVLLVPSAPFTEYVSKVFFVDASVTV